MGRGAEQARGGCVGNLRLRGVRQTTGARHQSDVFRPLDLRGSLLQRRFASYDTVRAFVWKATVMTTIQAPTPTPTPEEEARIEQARHEAQERVAALHVEEGTVQSEKAQNSPHPDDHD